MAMHGRRVHDVSSSENDPPIALPAGHCYRKIVMADLLWAVSSFSKHPYFTLMLLMLAMLTFGESNVLLLYY